ncbi:RnfABCDGE type electron transport complex subunit D [Sutcliffiella rhizosphaerae]|uniref:Ion-translocating oxidoreductase complex subunit D n=1 Tax=Sutcliffiella rhizosphaerae TaxID=2880967 RepID=A0ABN8ADR2_9BACI|nr:RnfABCDGE type electron transport complex subunit D [Sutcliffiella rhizosphaerae]CAG9623398.1 Ion-translocating oxidoreductase complex subunit D [Sutcliffiella rhizosphaerae]
MSTDNAITQWKDYKFDPRYLIIIFLFSFVVAGQTYLNFLQGFEAIIASVLTTTITEMILSRIFLKKTIFPLSAFITGLGISLLIASNYIWPYIVTGIIAIGLKYLLRYKGAHVFNPNNIAVVLMITILPSFVVVSPKQWTNGFLMMTIIICLGFLLVKFAKRIEVCLSFIITFLVFAFIRHIVYGAPLFAALGPLLGASTQLFIFFMITDPKTSPKTTKGKIAYGITIATIDAILRINRIPFAPFYALFITCIVFTLPYRYFTNKITSLRSLEERI